MGAQKLYKQKLVWKDDQIEFHTLPNEPISKIVLRGHGTVGTCTGDYTANTAVEWIKVFINGKLFVDWSGRNNIADKLGVGIQALRDFYLQKHNVAMPAEAVIVELPDAIPVGAAVDIQFKWCLAAACGCSSADLTDYYLDILYEREDLVKNRVIIPYITWGEKNYVATSGIFVEYLPAMPKKLRHLILLTIDNDGDPADDDLDEITISMGAKLIFHGEIEALGQQFESVSKVGHTAGIFHINFPKGLWVPTNTLQLKYYISSAGTNTRVHWYAICY